MLKAGRESPPSVLITGAASGIGRACAHRFAQAGWRVGLVDVQPEALAAVLAEMLSPHVQTYALDVTDAEALRDAMSDFCGDGWLDVLVNNAGVLEVGRFHTVALEHHRRMVEVNLIGVIHGAHAAFPYLKAARGTLINMGSASAIFGTPDFASYSASKCAVKGLTEALAAEWAQYGIAVCDLMPPFVDTPMLAPQRQQSRLFAALGVGLTPQAVAQAVFALTRRRHLHNPLTWQVGALMLLSRWTPVWLQLRWMRVLAGTSAP